MGELGSVDKATGRNNLENAGMIPRHSDGVTAQQTNLGNQINGWRTGNRQTEK